MMARSDRSHLSSSTPQRRLGKAREPLLERYITTLRQELQSWQVPRTEVLEIVGEIESHVSDGNRAGRSTADVLKSLGPAEELAEAYGAALRLDPR